jgi:cellulose synthase/poly-beta-1,6-N-acetylglucosamine synthase-like glycosyltransferase
MLFSVVKSGWHLHYTIPRKSKTAIKLDEEQRERSKIFTLLIPAFKEYEVIENTIASVANLNYYPGKYHVLLVLDEKEIIEKDRDSRIIIPTAQDILNGRYTDDQLKERIRNVRVDLTENDVGNWVNYFLKKAEVLSFAVLAKFNGESDLKDVTIPIAFSLLRNQTIKEETRNREDFPLIFQEANDLVEKVKKLSIERDTHLSEQYDQHPFFETTIDVVKRLLKKYNAEGSVGSIKFTIVPANYDGSYRFPKIMDKVVQSSKGRALNWALNEIEEVFPDTEVIGIYDSDGRPHKDVLAYINTEMLNTESKYVFYQGPIYLVRNFFDVHWICKQSGLQSTAWHRIFYPMLIVKNQKKIIHFSGTNYFYTIEAIRKTDGYPPFHPTEDLGLAYDVYALRLEGKLPDLKIVSHPYEEVEQTTQSWRAWYKQQYRWSSGSPYQIRTLRQNDRIPKMDRAKLIARLVWPLPLSIYAIFLGIVGLFLTGLALMGLGTYPYLPPGLDKFVYYTMLIGFVVFLATPEFIFFWSIKKGYLKSTSNLTIVKDFFIILITTIPYFIIAAFPIIQAWVKPLRGWGSKTPRTDERGRTKEEEYLRTYRTLIMS